MEKVKPHITYVGFYIDLEILTGENARNAGKVKIKNRERRMMYNLYNDQAALIGLKREFREVNTRKGCALSSLIFNLYIEEPLKELKERSTTAIQTKEGKNK